ncbi:hypothetical protein [Trichococcus collinsii]|uniref:Uncharacterized protein n=1 Tax=Trichococcus collinsii TaxID=157076 RepID=A0AB37ZVU0_9LACT|nr:hypothetical protein [Trichococcus collinsii]CZQ85277.1 Hypothetical protein Tcol_487 [Trichococcus collinsii]SDZ79599.1 hypothetical protein SAMN04488525_101191 [Trichococcus collinsii]
MKKIVNVLGVLVASIFTIAIFPIISPIVLVLGGYGIWYFLKKTPNPKKMKLAILGAVIGLFGCFALTGCSGGENSANETTVKQSQVESSSTKEKTKKELAAEEKAKVKSEQEKLLKNATAAISLVEKNPSRVNFTKAASIVDKLDKPSQELTDKLKAVEERVILEEENLKLAEVAIASAEAAQTRENYENAKSTLAVLVIPNSTFTNRLSNVEGVVVEKEAAEQAAAAQAEADRIAAEQAAAAQAEADRIAAEQAAAAQAEADRIASEQAAAAQAAVQPVGQTVYIAPGSGTKYHFDSSCRGLNNANSIVSMTLSAAQAQSYTLCGWED